MTNYQKGYRFEYKVEKIFKENGFIATRSPASKTPIDIYVMSDTVNYLAQCKTTNKEKLYIYKLTDLIEQADKINATPLLIYSFYYTTPYVKEVEKKKYSLSKEKENLELQNYLKNKEQ